MQKMASQKKAMHIKSVQKVWCTRLKTGIGASLAVQWLWLTLPVFQCRGPGLDLWLGSIPDWEIKMPPASWGSQKEKKKNLEWGSWLVWL